MLRVPGGTCYVYRLNMQRDPQNHARYSRMHTRGVARDWAKGKRKGTKRESVEVDGG